MVRIWMIAALVFLSLVGPSANPSAAAARNPELTVREEEDDKPAARRPLRISRLTVEVDVLGGMAATTLTAQIANPTSDVLEGDFVFDLPAGSVVTGYALDVDGRMIDGVLEAPRKAKLAYEATVRRGIDPGLGEVTRENAFRTRVYPILEGKGRTVRLAFVTPFDAAAPYRLPLSLPEPVDEAAVVIRSPEANRRIQLGGDLPLEFSSDPAERRAVLRRQPLEGVLELRAPAVRADVTVSRHASGQAFFDIQDTNPPTASAPGRVRIYWDASRSRADDDHRAEIQLLRRYLAAARPGAVDLILLNDLPTEVETISADPDAAAARMGAVSYRGATSYRGLTEAKAPPAEACILVSDGRPTVDSYSPADLGCRLFTLSSGDDANRALLAAFARASGGAHLDLAARRRGDLLDVLMQGGSAVAIALDAAGRPASFVRIAAPRGRWRIVGPAPEGGEVRVRLANGETRAYPLPAEPARHDGAGAVWAANQVADLAARDRPDGDAVLALSRRYRVASDQASFVVLENASQYAEAGIEPPAAFGKAALAEYAEMRREIEALERTGRQERLASVIASWEAQKAWWNTRFDPKARARREKTQGTPLAAPPAPALARRAPPAVASPAIAFDSSGLQEVVVTGSKMKEPDGSQITVTVEPWNPKRPYLDALRAAPPDRFWAIYEAQLAKYGRQPAFNLDVAEFLFRSGRPADARRVVLEAVEAPTANVTTLTIVADRLHRYGDDARALWMYDQIAFLEPDRPQPLRNLALALADRAEEPGAPDAQRRGDYLRALDLLAEVVLRPWQGDYDGIELISLMEANRVVARLKALGVEQTRLDPRLVALLDVDLRVVLEWNTDETDMDLWIDEPNGERSIYSNPETAIGGRLSNDMTGGYGPEEYLLRRAPNGGFEVRVNVFATDVLNPNGATTVRATLFRNYGRPTEAKEALELELKGNDDGAVLVGRVRVAPAAR